MDKHALQIEQFANTQFTPENLMRLAQKFHWELYEDQSEYTDGICLEFRFQQVFRLLIVCDAEQTLAVSLCAKIETCDPIYSKDFHMASWPEYQQVFNEALIFLERVWGPPDRKDKYLSPFTQILHRHALWQRSHSKLLLVEHDEGDGQSGHIATVDLRVIPAKSISFPLETNIIL